MQSHTLRAQTRKTIASRLLAGFVFVVVTMPAQAQREYVQPVEKGMLLVASPSMGDPNFRQTVLLILQHGRGGTVGVILNRPTDVLLSEVLPDLLVLKGTSHRLFTGGPVERRQMVLLFRLQGAYPDTRVISNSVYMGTPRVLEQVMAQRKPTETFRAFSGFAGWAPGQLEDEMLEGAWGVLPNGAFDIFDKDPTTFWPDSLTRLQAPRTISSGR